MNTQSIINKYGKGSISDQQFDYILDDVLHATISKLKTSPKFIVPTLFVVEDVTDKEIESGNIRFKKLYVDRELNSEEDRDLFLLLLGASFIQKKLFPSALFLVSEAWIKDLRRNDSVYEKDSDVRESVLVSGLTIDGRSNFAEIPVTRDKGKKMNPLIDIKLHYSNESMNIRNDTVLSTIFQGFITACEAATAATAFSNYVKKRS